MAAMKYTEEALLSEQTLCTRAFLFNMLNAYLFNNDGSHVKSYVYTLAEIEISRKTEGTSSPQSIATGLLFLCYIIYEQDYNRST